MRKLTQTELATISAGLDCDSRVLLDHFWSQFQESMIYGVLTGSIIGLSVGYNVRGASGAARMAVPGAILGAVYGLIVTVSRSGSLLYKSCVTSHLHP